MNAAVVLVNPKTPYNVGSVIRACSIFGVPILRWTGRRITAAEARVKAGSSTKSRTRFPREERLKDYSNVDWRVAASEQVVSAFAAERFTPVAVEVRDASEWLDEFVHPHRALYVFGPEDGSIPKGVLAVCHRFVRIRTATRTPLNLAAAVNVVLHDRYVKDHGRCEMGKGVTEMFMRLLYQDITEAYDRVEEIVRSRGWRDVVLGEEITGELEKAKDALFRARLLADDETFGGN